MAAPSTVQTTLNVIVKANLTLSVPSLQSAIQSLVEVIRPFEKVKQSEHTLQELLISLYRLNSVVITPLSTSYNAPGLSSELGARLESLARELSEIAKSFSWLKKYRKKQASVSGDDTLSSAIVDVNKEIVESMHRFSVWYSQERRALADGSGRRSVSPVAEHLVSKEVERLPQANAATYTSISRQNLPLCLLGTREAILNTADIWLNGNSYGMLVIKGSAGTGKSTIARTVAALAADQHRLAASFFFSKDDANRKSPALFFPTIAFQLAHHSEDFATKLSDILKDSPETAKKPLDEQFQKLIIEPLGGIEPAQPPLTRVIIVDGLDECERQGATQILQLLVEGLPKLPASLKILITTRPEPHFRLGSLGAQVRLNLDRIEGPTLEGDTRRLLQHRLSQSVVQEVLPGCKWEPKQEDMNILVKGTGRTLLIPAVIEKFVKSTIVRNPQRQLDAILEGMKRVGGTKSPRSIDIDYIYSRILEITFPATTSEIDARENFHAVIGTIIVLEVPLPLQPLCRLLGTDPTNTAATLGSLTSLINPGKDGICPHLHHHSFRDFITTHNRCKNTRFLIKPATYHEKVVGRCFDVMAHLLKRNICQIPPPDQYLENDAIANLEAKVKEHIPQELEYACCYWASHLSRIPPNCQPILEMLERFVFKHLLFWLEALSLTGKVDKVCPALRIAQKYAVSSGAGERLRTTINHAMRSIMAYQAIIEMSALHIYYSVLSFAPSRSMLLEVYAADAAGSPRVLQGREQGWNSLLFTFKGHTSYAYFVVFSHDGTELVSAGGDNTIRLWDATTGSAIAVLNGHTAEVYYVTFSPDGSVIMSASNDQTIRLWNATTRSLIATIKGHAEAVNCATFSPDGTLIASVSDDKSVRLWDVATRAHKATLEGHTSWVVTVVFSPDGAQLASASGDKTVKIWEVATGSNTITLEGHSGGVRAVAFSPDGSQLASGGDDKSIRLWDAVTGAHKSTLSGHTDWVWDVKFSPDGTLVVSACADSTIKVWNAVTGVLISTMKGHSGALRGVAFSHDGTRLASGSEDHTVRTWNVPGGDDDSVEGHLAEVDSVVLSPSAKQLVSAADSSFMLWDTAVGKLIAALDDGIDDMTPTVFSPDGTVLAFPTTSNTIMIWDATSGVCKTTLEGHTDRVVNVIFSNDGTRLASASLDNTIRLWDPTTGANSAILESTFGRTLCISFSPDGTQLAAASEDGDIQMWDTTTGAHMTTLARHSGAVRSIVFSWSGTQLASASDDGVVVLWDTVGGAHLADCKGHSGPVICVAFSLDGAQAASGSADNTIRVWKSSDGAHIASLEGHSGQVWDVIFSPDGSRLASGSDDLTIRIWDISSSVLLITLGGHYRYPDISSVFSDHSLHVVKKRGYPVLVRLENHNGAITQLPLCWLPPTVEPTRTRSNHGVVAVGTSNGQVLYLNVT